MRRLLIPLGLPALSAVLLALSFPAAHLWWLAWVALAPLVWAGARQQGMRPVALQWFLAGWLFHTLTLQWLFANVFWAGGWAIIGQQLLVTALALFWAGMGALWKWLHARAPRWSPLLLAGLFIAVEWGHANLFTGFGWSAIAYSQGPDLALLQVAALGGTALVALPIVYLNAALGLFFARTPWRLAHLAAALLLAAAMHGAGALMLGAPDRGSAPLRAGIFQSNYTNEMKWDGEYTLEMIERAVRHSARLEEFEPVDLMVWPEALVMHDFSHPQIVGWLREYAQQQDTVLYTGAVRRDGAKSFNSSVLVSRTGEVADSYDKVHLAPFGEYVPFENLIPFVQQVVQSSTNPGEEQKVLESDGIRIGPLICFEVLFSPMSQKLRAMGARTLVVITNLAWFGHSAAIRQELEIARLRAIEARLPLIHAGNTGISGVFDPWGRFESVDSWATFDGRLSQLEERGDPMMLAHRRAVGAFDLAAPAPHPLPGGPVWMPVALMALTALLGAWAVFSARRPQAPAAAPPPPQPAEKPKAAPSDDISI